MKRRVLAILSGVLMVFGSLLASPAPALAADKACGGSLLGLRPWYYGICSGEGESTKIKKVGQNDGDLAKFIWTIVLNVLFDLSLVIGYIALAMIIYGGYLYIISQGDPGKMAKGKKTLMSAVIGTTIALSASVVINTVSAVLDVEFYGGSIAGNTASRDMLSSILKYAYSMAGLVAVAFIIKGGFDYIFSQGDPGKTAKGTRTLITAIAGLVIVILARLLTALILSTTGGGM